MEKKHILNSPRLQEFQNARKAERKKKLTWFFVILFVVMIGLLMLSRYSKFRIYEVEIVGNKVIESSEIEKNVLNSIHGYYFFVIPRNNFALIPENAIRKNLELAFPRLEKIDIVLSGDNKLQISLSERGPKYLWCGEVLSEDVKLENTKCYFMDQNGYIFDEAPFFSGNVYLRFMGGIGGYSGFTLGQYFEPKLWQSLQEFKSASESVGLEPTLFYLNPNQNIEVYLNHKNEPPLAPRIIFKKDANISEIIINFKSAVASAPLKTKLEENYDSLSYIDLSYGNKIYYKFKNAEPLEQTKTQ